MVQIKSGFEKVCGYFGKLFTNVSCTSGILVFTLGDLPIECLNSESGY